MSRTKSFFFWGDAVKGTRRNLDSLETNTNQLKFRRCNKGQQCPHVSAHDDSYADKIFIE